jgi:hypothetical protein
MITIPLLSPLTNRVTSPKLIVVIVRSLLLSPLTNRVTSPKLIVVMITIQLLPPLTNRVTSPILIVVMITIPIKPNPLLENVSLQRIQMYLLFTPYLKKKKNKLTHVN